MDSELRGKLKQKGLNRLFKSFKYAFTGIFTALKQEKNMNIHLAMAILVIIMGIILKISKTEWMVCIIMITLVICSELFNTIVDMITTEKNEKAKIAKDISAGAVLITAIGAAVVGIIIFLPKMAQIFWWVQKIIQLNV